MLNPDIFCDDLALGRFNMLLNYDLDKLLNYDLDKLLNYDLDKSLNFDFLDEFLFPSG